MKIILDKKKSDNYFNQHKLKQTKIYEKKNLI